MKFKRGIWRLLWVALLTLGSAQAEVWHFALIGDVPYSQRERAELPAMLSAMSRGREPLAFIAHVGDIKHGQERCDDALFFDRLACFQASPVPFIFVPGDNEWTDCDRASNGGYAPRERLARLRQIFWPDDMSLGQQRLALERQAGPWREHSRFRIGPVLFVTLNLPGGNNNWGMTDTPSAEYLERNPAVIAWLVDAFALARQEKLRGVVLLFQANPGFKYFAQGLGISGYRHFLETLRAESERFGAQGGQVVAVHGDTHRFRVDRPLRDRQGRIMPYFTRVETFGYPLMGWVLGRIDTRRPELFAFEPHPWPAQTQP
ncbi:MAG: hypothetical protein N3C59_09540 [Azovibrio sp.]|nr:hypothetical protein [Azovibrio sp.]